MATRTLGMSEQAVGLSYVCLGFGTVLASLVGDRISKRLGPGPSMTVGIGLCSVGWLLLAVAPVGPLGCALFAVNLMLFGLGAVMIFINFISLRQAVTPAPMLGRMTSTMRWLILLPAAPGALIGGWLGEHVDLRASLAFSGLCGLVLTIAAWRNPRAARGARAAGAGAGRGERRGGAGAAVMAAGHGDRVDGAPGRVLTCPTDRRGPRLRSVRPRR